MQLSWVQSMRCIKLRAMLMRSRNRVTASNASIFLVSPSLIANIKTPNLLNSCSQARYDCARSVASLLRVSSGDSSIPGPTFLHLRQPGWYGPDSIGMFLCLYLQKMYPSDLDPSHVVDEQEMENMRVSEGVIELTSPFTPITHLNRPNAGSVVYLRPNLLHTWK